MNKKGLIVATGTVITALSLSGCGMNDRNAMDDRRDNVGYERVNFDNRPTNPYSVNYRYVNDMNYPNDRDMYARQNVHFGNDRINEGLNSEYKNDGIIRDGRNGRNANNYNNQYSLTDPVRNDDYDVNNNTLIPFTNISTNTRMSDGDRIYADQISKRVEQMANVKDANTVVVGNQVLVAVDINKKNIDERAFRSKIKDTLSPYTRGKKVYVTFDGNIRNDVMNIPNDTNNIVQETRKGVNNVYEDVKRGVKDVTNNK